MLLRCVLIERRTEYQELLARHGTRDQARFFLAGRGGDIDQLERRHNVQRRHHQDVLAAVPAEWRRASVERGDLDRFLFEPDNVIVVLGQDGLVANAAKYLAEQPLIGLNPDPDVNVGVLVPHPPAAAADLMRDVQAGRHGLERRTMVTATLDDGQTLTALNEIFVGHASHQSARYAIAHAGIAERQSSSGLIVATGTGATGWAASIHRQRRSALPLPAPTDPRLAFFVREPWPSPTTGTTLTEGVIDAGSPLEITCGNGEGAVIFGDGIEADSLQPDWGQRVNVGIAARTLQLVR